MDITGEVYPHQIGFNLLPHIGSFKEEGYTSEEWKMVRETRPHLTAACEVAGMLDLADVLVDNSGGVGLGDFKRKLLADADRCTNHHDLEDGGRADRDRAHGQASKSTVTASVIGSVWQVST